MGTIKQLRYWAFKILPLAYDDSLSYYEVLSKVTAKLNEVIDTTNTLPELISKEVETQLKGDGDIYTRLFNGLINAIATNEGEATYTPNAKEGGELIWLNGTLYKVVSPMAVGVNYVAGSNIVPVDISEELADIKQYITGTRNEHYDERSANAYDTGVYLFWKDALYKTTKDVAVNDILATGDEGNLVAVDIGKEISNNYTEMHEADNNLQTQIDGNDGDIEKLQKDLNTETSQRITEDNGINARISNIVAQAGTDNTEITDARTGYYGDTYSTLHDFLNTTTYFRKQETGFSLDNQGDIDTFTNAGYYFVSSTDGVTDLKNLPINSAGYLFNISNKLGTTGMLQIYVEYNSPHNIYWRILDIHNEWSEWNNTEIGFHPVIKAFPSDTSYENPYDLNDLTDTSIRFVSITGNQISATNTPIKDAGWIITLGTEINSTFIQMFYGYNTSRAFYRIRLLSGSWTDWTEVSTNKGTYHINNVPDDTPSCDDLTETGTYFISSTAGVLNVKDYPQSEPAILIVYPSNTAKTLILQYWIGYNTNNIWLRWKKFSGWTTWSKLETDSTGETVQNTYNNTYNITTAPNITTDTNGWLQAIDNENTEESNATDMTGSIMSMLTDTGYCHLGEGTFYVSGNIDMPEGSIIEGCGDKTIVRLLQSTTSGYVFKLGKFSTIKDLTISGQKANYTGAYDTSTTDIGTRDGIHFTADADGTGGRFDANATINNVRIINFTGSGIYLYETGGGTHENLNVSDCNIWYCRVGINVAQRAEYCKFNFIVTYRCYYACINNGGNNVFTGCTFHGVIGLYMDGTKSNALHGTCNGCTFNHINNTGNPSQLGKGVAVQIEGGIASFLFANCQFWYSRIIVSNSLAIIIDNCVFGGGINVDGYNVITVEGSYGALIENCWFQAKPNLTLTTKTKLINCYSGDSLDNVTA